MSDCQSAHTLFKRIWPLNDHIESDDRQASFLEKNNNRSETNLRDQLKATNTFIPANGKFFKRFGVSDMRRLQQAEAFWEQHKSTLPYPKSAIPVGNKIKTKSGLLAHQS